MICGMKKILIGKSAVTVMNKRSYMAPCCIMVDMDMTAACMEISNASGNVDDFESDGDNWDSEQSSVFRRNIWDEDTLYD